jgi:sialate O-acetylesterase
MIKKHLLLITLLMAAIASNAQLSLPRLFADHMVLQRDMPVKFWGKAKPNTNVAVSIDGQNVATTADAAGNWQVAFPDHKAGGPFQVVCTSADATKTIEDVWFGDVWVASGQSNMEWKLGWNVNNWEEEAKDSDFPQIRFFEVPKVMGLSPKDDYESGEWVVSSPTTSAQFSAVAWFFAKKNHLEKGVPVGILNSAWGGTPAEAWFATGSVKEVPGYEKAAGEMLDKNIDWAQRQKENEERNELKWRLIQDNNSYLKLRAQATDYDDASWKTISLPKSDSLSDFVWVRKWVELPATENASISIGDIGQLGTVFINGKEVYKKGWQDQTSPSQIPEGVLVKGANLIAIRVVNDWDNRARIGKKDQFWIEAGSEKISLEGAWKMSNTIEPKMPEVEFFHWRPGMIFNGMINPMVGYGIKGVIWYQGENNAGQPHLYNKLFEALITDWRVRWDEGDFPFLFVQLANYMARKEQPSESQWAELRESQTQTLSLPNTGMATIIDIGEAEDIHPRNKQDVGDRLWLAARKVAYGEDLVYSGPTNYAFFIKKGKITVKFKNTGSGLMSASESITGFEIAGADKKYVWANAKIKGNQVIIWSDAVKQPLNVRYAWADNPACSLYNKEGLPAVPFRIEFK